MLRILIIGILLSLPGGGGLLAKPKAVPPDVQAERDANRSYIEVEGVMYPVYLYEEEAKPKRRAKVVLPKEAKRQGRGGTVLLGTIINPQGEVINLTVAMSNAETDIQEAAMTAVAQWSFPIKHDAEDRPIAYAVMVPIRVDATPFFGPRGG